MRYEMDGYFMSGDKPIARIQAASAHIPSEPEPSPLIEPVRYTR